MAIWRYDDDQAAGGAIKSHTLTHFAIKEENQVRQETPPPQTSIVVRSIKIIRNYPIHSTVVASSLSWLPRQSSPALLVLFYLQSSNKKMQKKTKKKLWLAGYPASRLAGQAEAHVFQRLWGPGRRRLSSTARFAMGNSSKPKPTPKSVGKGQKNNSQKGKFSRCSRNWIAVG